MALERRARENDVEIETSNLLERILHRTLDDHKT